MSSGQKQNRTPPPPPPISVNDPTRLCILCIQGVKPIDKSHVEGVPAGVVALTICLLTVIFPPPTPPVIRRLSSYCFLILLHQPRPILRGVKINKINISFPFPYHACVRVHGAIVSQIEFENKYLLLQLLWLLLFMTM